MKKIQFNIYILIILFVALDTVVMAENNKVKLSENARVVLESINWVYGEMEHVAIFAAQSLQMYLHITPGTSSTSLSGYNLLDPYAEKVKTKEGRTYFFVMFKETKANNLDHVAFAILQKCDTGRMLPLIRGFAAHGDEFVNDFRRKSRDSSAEYFKWNECTSNLDFERTDWNE